LTSSTTSALNTDKEQKNRLPNFQVLPFVVMIFFFDEYMNESKESANDNLTRILPLEATRMEELSDYGMN